MLPGLGSAVDEVGVLQFAVRQFCQPVSQNGGRLVGLGVILSLIP